MEVNLLALDTSTRAAALALALAEGRLFEAAPDPDRKHGRSLLPAIADLLRQAELEVRAIQAIGVGIGPGSYTGLRIGLTAAKTLAYAIGANLVGFDSLELLAQNAPPDALRVAVISDAQRDTLYSADFRRTLAGGPLERSSPTRVETRQGWLERLEPETLVLGPDLHLLRPPLPATILRAPAEAGIPRGRHVAHLARTALHSGHVLDPALLEPAYLRASAAEEQWKNLK
jgi:tRNA threonylcarbamoyladenosine biosynthesis protein TsaB